MDTPNKIERDDALRILRQEAEHSFSTSQRAALHRCADILERETLHLYTREGITLRLRQEAFHAGYKQGFEDRAERKDYLNMEAWRRFTQ